MGVRWMDHPAIATVADVKPGDLVGIDQLYGPQEVLELDLLTTDRSGVEAMRLQVRPLGPPGASSRYVIRGPWERCLWWPAIDTSPHRHEPIATVAL